MSKHTKAARKGARRRHCREVVEWSWFVAQCLASGSPSVRALGERLRHAPVGTVWFSGTPERRDIRVTWNGNAGLAPAPMCPAPTTEGGA